MIIVKKILNFLFLSFPLAFVSGSFLTDLTLSLISILIIFIIIKEKKIKYVKNVYVYFSFLFLLYLIITTVFSENISLSIETSSLYIRFIFFAIALSYFLYENNYFFSKLHLIIFIIFCFLFLNSTLQYTFGYDIFFNQLHPSYRVSGYLGNELILGSIAFKLFTIYAFFFFLSKSNNNYFLIVFFITLFIILLSGERNSLLYFIIFNILILIFLKDLNPLYFKKILPFSIIALILFFSFLPTHKERLISLTLSQFLSENNSEDYLNRAYFYSPNHEALIKTGISISKDYFFFGSGPKTFRYLCKYPNYKTDIKFWHDQTKRIRIAEGCSTHPHNTYIQLLVETGFVSIILILGIFFICLGKLIKIRMIYSRKSPTNNLIIIILCTSLIITWPLLPTGNFFNNYNSSYISFIFGLLLYFNILTNNSEN